MRLRRLAYVVAFSFLAIAPTRPASAADPLVVYSAGSIHGALDAVLKRYAAEGGTEATLVSGPAGKMLERIEAGDKADVFVSANMAHAQRLTAEHKATATVVLVRNRICVSARRELGMTTANLLDKLLDPKVRLGTSTPKVDPGGDYAWELFDKASTVRPGATAALRQKARQIGGKGGGSKDTPPTNALAALDRHEVDAMIGFCSHASTRSDDSVDHVELPSALAISVDYGMTVLTTSPDAARREAADRLALYLLSPAAQTMMAQYGFMPVAVSNAP